MKKFDGYENIQVSEGSKKLPAGGYKCSIKQVKIEAWKNGQGESLVVLYDIIEGEHKDFFKQNFETQTQDKKWKGIYRTAVPTNSSSDSAKKAFKSFITSVEKSNPGYNWNWDENTLKGKKVGLVFGEVEKQKQKQDGSTYMWTEPRWPRSLDTVLDAEVPAPKMLQGGTAGAPANTGSATGSWNPTAVQEAADDDDLPF